MLTGLPVIYGIKPSEEEAVASHPLGAIGYTADGRKFRYAKFGAALTAGNLLQSPAEDANQDLTPTAALAGVTEVSLTPGASVAANLYAGGYLLVTKTAGNGILYRIKSHPALVSGTANTIKLLESLKVAITSSSRIDLIQNPYSGVIKFIAISPTSSTVGIAYIATTSGYYGWIQTSGAGMVLADAPTVSDDIQVGEAIVASLTTDGAVTAALAASTEVCATVGTALTVITSGENGLALLKIE